jgi:Saxitoxin biosynthesis operon protein SxtJ
MSRPVKGSSDRAFGLTFAIFFALIGLWPWAFHGDPPLWWLLVLGALFCAVAFIAPRVLAPLNRAWFRFGLALHWIVNPLIMALLYYFAVVPMGLIVRLAGKDLLQLERNAATASYWVRREPPGPAPASMSKQF